MTTETEIFRVERIEDGAGPYRTLMYGNIHNDDYAECGRFGRHPSPYDDDLEDVTKTEHFGFRSMESLRVWFNASERAHLHRAGFHVAVYRAVASLVRNGAKQCCFDISQATRTRVEPLT